MKCLDGADAGTEVIFKANTDGGIKTIVMLVDLLRDRINGGQHDGKIVPIALLEKDSYQHSQHGRVWIPVLNTIDWMSLDGPARHRHRHQRRSRHRRPSSNRGAGASRKSRHA
jgi:hypothetical protein